MARRVLLAAIVLALGIPAAALAGGPDIRERDSFSESDLNFCGTGETVQIEGTAVFNGWLGETGGDPTQVIKSTLNLHITYSNPDNGTAVVERWSASATNEIIVGTEAGPHTHEFTESGLKATLRLKNGRLLTRDAGSLTYRVSFDAMDSVVGFELVDMNGPHPAFEEDLFCSTVVEALGLD
jgi:hypothetical protein